MSKPTTVRIKGSAWQAIAEHIPARDHKHPDHPPVDAAAGAPKDNGPDLLLDLAVRHFDDQLLSAGEATRLAAAMLHTAATGETREVTSIGIRDRAYRFRRHVGGISIRAGEGQIRLPMRSTLRLAGMLPQMGRATAFTEMAA